MLRVCIKCQCSISPCNVSVDVLIAMAVAAVSLEINAPRVLRSDGAIELIISRGILSPCVCVGDNISPRVKDDKTCKNLPDVLIITV